MPTQLTDSDDGSDESLPIWDGPTDPVAELRGGTEHLKPFIRAAQAHLDEARLHFDSNNIHLAMADTSNVVNVVLTLHADAFKRYEVADETEIGVDLSRFHGLIRACRQNHDDVLDLSVNRGQIQSTIERDTTPRTTYTDSMRPMNPDSVREDADMREYLANDDELEYHDTTLPAGTLLDAVGHTTAACDYVEFGSSEDNLWIGGKGDETTSGVQIAECGVGVEVSSMLSGDFLEDTANCLSRAIASETELTVHLGDGVPLFVEFERETADGETALTGTVAQAPRIEA
jgi:DNA polymerase III sliding clamp (beta) subunit (PCNA family)